jgi:hypothetical protein
VTGIARRLPPGIIDELKVSAKQLASVRGPRQLVTLLESEVGRLSGVIVPLLARYPLPVRHPRIAAASAAAAAAGAAAIVSLDELAVLFTDGAAAPTVPGAGVALLVAFVLEVWIAASLRVHQVERAGRQVDMDVLSSEVSSAVLGVDMVAVRALAGRVTGAVGKRLSRRWAGALVPGVGLVVDGTAAGKTVRAITDLPVDAHPLAVG